MVSGVSFKNPAEQQKDLRRKSRVSRGLLFSFVILFVTIVIYGAAFTVKKSHESTVAKIDLQIVEKQDMIAEAAEGPLAGYVAKSNAISEGLFDTTSSEMALAHLQETMVPRVVLKSFFHTYDAREGAYRIAITADADNFDVLAAQIDAWKGSTYYSVVNAKETSRDDEGRIIFSVDMLLNDDGVGPYDEVIVKAEEIVITEEEVDAPVEEDINVQ